MNKVTEIFVSAHKGGHTVVIFDNHTHVCSCNHPNDWTRHFANSIPSLRSTKCIVCGGPSGIEFKELDDFLCGVCIESYFDWKTNHPTYLPVDFLRMKLDSELRSM
jgi:hypothetical protein